jgi:hypothetical protein
MSAVNLSPSSRVNGPSTRRRDDPMGADFSFLRESLPRQAGGLEPVISEPATDLLVRLRASRAIPLPTPVPIPTPIPRPLFFGSRFLIWKQDPSVGALGRRLTYIPTRVLNGPKDRRIETECSGATPVTHDLRGDFIYPAGTAEADCAHTFAVIRETLSMYERAHGGTEIPWAWNTSGNTDPVTAYPRAGVTANAFYSRSQKALKFFYFTPSGASGMIYTCRSLDIVSHETGHAILDGLKPGWLGFNNPPQTGGLHESFGDLSALFLALAQLDQVEALVAMTKANLHAKNFLAALAEQFGTAFGSSIGLRNADNDLKLSQVGNEVHAISQVFTGGIYDVLADIFAFERGQQWKTKDLAQVLLEVAQHLRNLLIAAIVKSPTDLSNVHSQPVHLAGGRCLADAPHGPAIRDR